MSGCAKAGARENSFDNPSVLAIVILPYTKRSRCDQTLKSVLGACLHGGGGPQLGEVKYGGSPHLSCKRDQIKMRD